MYYVVASEVDREARGERAEEEKKCRPRGPRPPRFFLVRISWPVEVRLGYATYATTLKMRDKRARIIASPMHLSNRIDEAAQNSYMYDLFIAVNCHAIYR